MVTTSMVTASSDDTPVFGANTTLPLFDQTLLRNRRVDCLEAASPGTASGAGQKKAARDSDRLSAEGREGEDQGHREVRRRERRGSLSSSCFG